MPILISEPSQGRRLLLRLPVLLLLALTLSACGSRQVQDSLVGSTAQRLVSYAVDEMARNLPEDDFAPLRGQRLHLVSHGLTDPRLQAYADARVAVELQHRFGAEVVDDAQESDQVLRLFYTSIGTDQSHLGFYLPLGFVPGVDETTRINLITLEQFHGVVEMYYFLGPRGTEQRGEIVQVRRRTDALGLPIITIPISTLP